MSIKTLYEELHEITKTIRKKEDVLRHVKRMGTNYANKSDTGWLLSMFAGEAGTLLAVLSGIKARKWDDVVHVLEEEILLLKIDKKLKEKDIEEVLKKSPSS
jgi:hypothetical protein